MTNLLVATIEKEALRALRELMGKPSKDEGSLVLWRGGFGSTLCAQEKAGVISLAFRGDEDAVRHGESMLVAAFALVMDLETDIEHDLPHPGPILEAIKDEAENQREGPRYQEISEQFRGFCEKVGLEFGAGE